MRTASFFITLLTSSTLAASLHAQERNDSISVALGAGLSEAEILELTTPSFSTPSNALSTGLTPMKATDIAIDPILEPTPLAAPKIDINPWPRGSRLPHWATGFMYGNQNQSASLLYGYTAHAGIGVHQRVGRYWSFDGGASVSKYSVFYNSATLHGSATWQPNRYFSTTVFGSYTTGFLTQAPILPSFQWGGYITLQTDTDLPFGIDAGAQDYYDPMNGHYVAPIIRPFVKVGDAKMGIDFGPLIQNAINKANGHNDNGFTPIPKPIKAMPQVAPRR